MIGRPAARWRILMVADFIRVPSPAARMITSTFSVIRVSERVERGRLVRTCRRPRRPATAGGTPALLRSSFVSPHSFKRPAVTVVEPEDRIGERARIMPDVVPFRDDVAEERRHAELAHGIHIERYRKRILLRVVLEDLLRRPAAVHDHHVDDEARVLDD